MADTTSGSSNNTHSTPGRPRRPLSRFSRQFRRRLFLGCLCGIAIGGFGWYFGRPYFYVSQARRLLLKDPAAAALVLEQEVLSTSGSFPEAEVLWSHALLRSGRWVEAVGAFSQIKSPENAAPASLLALANDAVESKVNSLARVTLESVRAGTPERLKAVELLISLAENDGDFSKVLVLADELDQMVGVHGKSNLSRAYAFEQMMNLPAAADAYERALDDTIAVAEQEKILRTLVKICIQLARAEDARSYMMRLNAINKSDRSVSDKLSEARLRRLEGDITGAMKVIEEISTTSIMPPEVLEFRAALSIDRRDYSAAIDDLQQVLAAQPLNKQAHYRIAQALVKCGRTAEATVHMSENRRLLALSNRIVSLQMKSNRTSEETEELIDALEKSGMESTAAALLQRSKKSQN